MSSDNTVPPFDSLAAGSMKPNVVTVAHEVVDASQAYFSGGDHPFLVLFGFNASSQPEHSAGTAVDFMVYQDWTLGDWAADYIWANRVRLGLRWQIWRQRIRSTSPGHAPVWVPMADRGSGTQNHKDHIHCNFWERAYTGSGSNSPLPLIFTNPSAIPASGANQPDPAKKENPDMMPRIVKTEGSDLASKTDNGQVLLTDNGIKMIPGPEYTRALQRYLDLMNDPANPKNQSLLAIEIDRVNHVLNS